MKCCLCYANEAEPRMFAQEAKIKIIVHCKLNAAAFFGFPQISQITQISQIILFPTKLSEKNLRKSAQSAGDRFSSLLHKAMQKRPLQENKILSVPLCVHLRVLCVQKDSLKILEHKEPLAQVQNL